MKREIRLVYIDSVWWAEFHDPLAIGTKMSQRFRTCFREEKDWKRAYRKFKKEFPGCVVTVDSVDGETNYLR